MMFRKKSSKQHWYQMKFIYRVDGNDRFEMTMGIGFTNQADVFEHRKIKKSILPLHLNHLVPKNRLANGVILVEPVAYLGYFKRDNNSTKKKEDVKNRIFSLLGEYVFSLRCKP